MQVPLPVTLRVYHADINDVIAYYVLLYLIHPLQMVLDEHSEPPYLYLRGPQQYMDHAVARITDVISQDIRDGPQVVSHTMTIGVSK